MSDGDVNSKSWNTGRFFNTRTSRGVSARILRTKQRNVPYPPNLLNSEIKEARTNEQLVAVRRLADEGKITQEVFEQLTNVAKEEQERDRLSENQRDQSVKRLTYGGSTRFFRPKWSDYWNDFSFFGRKRGSTFSNGARSSTASSARNSSILVNQEFQEKPIVQSSFMVYEYENGKNPGRIRWKRRLCVLYGSQIILYQANGGSISVKFAGPANTKDVQDAIASEVSLAGRKKLSAVDFSPMTFIVQGAFTGFMPGTQDIPPPSRAGSAMDMKDVLQDSKEGSFMFSIFDDDKTFIFSTDTAELRTFWLEIIRKTLDVIKRQAAEMDHPIFIGDRSALQSSGEQQRLAEERQKAYEKSKSLKVPAPKEKQKTTAPVSKRKSIANFLRKKTSVKFQKSSTSLGSNASNKFQKSRKSLRHDSSFAKSSKSIASMNDVPKFQKGGSISDSSTVSGSTSRFTKIRRSDPVGMIPTNEQPRGVRVTSNRNAYSLKNKSRRRPSLETIMSWKQQVPP